MHQVTYTGIVEKGEGIAGPEYSIPTANLHLDSVHIDPGVYVGMTEYEGKQYPSAVCYGANDSEKFEVHLLDVTFDLLGKELTVHILDKVSEIIPWESKERMRHKILDDVHCVREYFNKKK